MRQRKAANPRIRSLVGGGRLGDLGKVLDKELDVHPITTLAERSHVDYFDFRIVKTGGTKIGLKDGELKKSYIGGEIGCGARVLYKGSRGFFSTNDVSKNGLTYALEQAVGIAKGMHKGGGGVEIARVKSVRKHIKAKMRRGFDDVATEDKYEMLMDIHRTVAEVDGIKDVDLEYSDAVRQTYILTSEGTEIVFEQPLTAIQGMIVAKHGGDVIGYRKRVGAGMGYEYYSTIDVVEEFRDAADRALKVLKGFRAPSGRFPVVADNDLTGVFVHEAVGHATEADLVLAGDSILDGMIGKKVGSEHVNIVDDPTIAHAFGTIPYDDEGVRAMRKDLITEGILRSYILSRETAAKLDMEPNGGARAESYSARPLVRMSNTCMLPKDWGVEEIIEGIDFGIYAKGTRGGQVDTAKGTFQFSAQEAYLIEKGEITKTLRDVSLSGETLRILKRIDAVGKDFKMGSPGYCGKGQIVPVGHGGPHIRIQEAIVGGG